jgi:hypothetical protein
LVNLVQNWSQLLDYARKADQETERAYRNIEEDGKTILLVLVGRFGFQKEVSSSTDPQLKKIVSTCEVYGFLNVSTTIPDEEFFFR